MALAESLPESSSLLPPTGLYIPQREVSLIPGINPEKAMEIISEESYLFFLSRAKRRQPWTVEKGKIILFKRDGAEDDLTERIYEEAPRLSAITLQVMRIFKAIEDDLPDFSLWQQHLTRNLLGCNRIASQWADEEGVHSDGIRFTQEASGLVLLDQIVADHRRNLKFVWRPPFPEDVRKMNGYGQQQEPHTSADYKLLAGMAEKDGAPTIGLLFRVISTDEWFHGLVYDGIFRIFYEHDPEGTVDDLLDATALFRLPEHGLETDYDEDSKVFQKLGFTPRRTLHLLTSTLTRTGVVTKEQIASTRKRYLGGLRIEAIQRREQPKQLELS